MARILQSMIDASEKAASVARSCIGVGENALLVAVKSECEANARFDKDFKTIADVLAQEAAKKLISSNFPALSPYIRGEECDEIGGKKIKIQNTQMQTIELLSSLVPSILAEKMAEAAHSDIKRTVSDLCEDLPEVDVNDLGIWIDPIDATAEFISGVCGEAEAGVGLVCVTVLIGAYLRSTGDPVMGVINQPFYKEGKGRVVWGIDYNGTKKWGGTGLNGTMCHKSTNIILMSNAENQEIKKKLSKSSFTFDTAPGAGYKLMKVCTGEADSYILSKGTTFKWDTCAPHAILKAKGGDIVNFLSQKPIKYNVPESKDNHAYCNASGIMAVNDINIIFKIMSSIQ